MLALLALAFSYLIDNLLLKNLIARTRPYEVIAGLHTLIGAQRDYSFPSGHTGSSFAAAVVLFCRLPKRLSSFLLLLAFLIGFSRLYVGGHYPSDIIVGAISGTLIALVLLWIESIPECRRHWIKSVKNTTV